MRLWRNRVNAEHSSLNVLITRILQIILSIVLILSIVGKLIDPKSTLEFIVKVGIIDFDARIIFSFVIFTELLLSLFIPLGIFRKKIFLFQFLLYLLFLMVIIVSIIKGFSSDCGCFGSLFPTDSWVLIISKNILLGIISFYLHLNYKETFTIETFWK